MPLIQLRDVQLAYGPQVLLDHVDLTLKRGEHIGLLGRNGEGKSTLLSLIAGTAKPDSGEVWVRPGTRIGVLPQALPAADQLTVFDAVARGLASLGELLAQYHVAAQSATPDLKLLERLQQQIEAQDGWRFQQRIEQTLQQLDLDADARMQELSGGWRRRVALAQALVTDPDVLLLDEPTNHLDLPAIQWLEQQLRDFRGTLVVITHDRMFLQAVANTIVELDRGHLRRQEGDYQGFLAMRAQQLAAEATANALFDKRLAEEEKWIRKGIEARRTRNEGRVRALLQMRQDRAARRELKGRASFAVEAGERSGKLVVECEHVNQSFNGKPVLKDFSTTILRGDRVGLIGPNGAGKSTLLNILLGRLTPDSGKVKLGTNLQVVYFDQLLTTLELDKTVIDNVGEGSDFIEINGKRKHVIGYLQDFLFAPDRVRQPVAALSGGERARLILAKLFARPANLLVLDEPTNDLDIETLELLEEILLDFPGTLLVVSHDRAFLDNVVTSSLVFEGDGVVREYVGTHYPKPSDSASRRGEGDKSAVRVAEAAKPAEGSAAKPAEKPAADSKARKLSFKEKRELEELPGLIEAEETAIAALEAAVADPQFFAQPHATSSAKLAELGERQQRLAGYYARWEALEG